MTAAIAPVQSRSSANTDPLVQQLLMRFIGALNRRRSYAAAHPMVLAAEQQLHEAAVAILLTRPVITIGVAKTDLLIDGEPYVTKSSFARELATRLHRRGVGAVTLQAGVPMLQLREILAWLATEPAADQPASNDLPPVLSGVSVTAVAYDQLSLGDSERAADATGAQLWRALAQLAGEGPGDAAANSGSTEDQHTIMQRLRQNVSDPDVARRTAIAFMDLAAQGTVAPVEGRMRIGEQLNTALDTLGESSIGPILHALGERSMQQRFISQVVDVLPVAAVASWLQVAAKAQEQQMSHHMLRLMSKLSTFAEVSHTAAVETEFRGAAQELVRGWSLEDPNPEEHAALLDRIALHEPTTPGTHPTRTHAADIESSRLVQMALEIDVAGADAVAAAETLVDHGAGAALIEWLDTVGKTDAAQILEKAVTSEKAIRALLLTEPVDRLLARALLERLDASYAETLLDVLEAAEARGTRMIVRQRLSEFGAAIAPQLTARLDRAPWYLVRNILTLLHDISEQQGGTAAGIDAMAPLLDHAQVQVRTEAFRLLLLDIEARDSAIQHALHDDNERMVVLALQALTEGQDGPATISDAIATQLMSMVEAETHSDTVRARMVRSLAARPNTHTRDWLISLVIKRSRILRRMTLADPTHTAVAAVHVLRRVFANDAIVVPVLALVSKEGTDRRWQARDPGSSVEHAT